MAAEAGSSDPSLARYARQMLFPGVGESGQRALIQARVTIVGLGATGSVLANLLARAGIGHLRLVDHDIVKLNNLQRQILYDEEDAAAGRSKVAAAARKLRQINSEITIEPLAVSANAANILGLVADADLVLDGTDNFAARYLINDACVKLGKPWVYCGVVAAYGMTITIRPGATACLRCIMEEPPPPGAAPTGDDAGIIGPIVTLMGSVVAAEAIKAIVGRGEPNTGMLYADLWEDAFDRMPIVGPRPGCPACGLRRFDFLNPS
jgi:adenylyltransferase/sulfurtransferase